MTRNRRSGTAVAIALAAVVAWACSGETNAEHAAGGGGTGSVHGVDGGGGWAQGGSDAGSPCGTPGSQEPCYAGPPSAAGIGVCKLGTQKCTSGGWSECAGSVLPSTESCGDGLDDDCDGSPDEGCGCQSGTTQPCYPGPLGSRGVGICAGGIQKCVNGFWDPACAGAVLPGGETCNDQDDNCNGQIDEGDPGGGAACNTGLAGPCATGKTSCSKGKPVCVPNGDPNDPACKPCAGCLGPHPDCTVACQKVAGRPSGSCAVPNSTDPGNCCACAAELDCSKCLAGFPDCDSACQNAGYAEGYCYNDKSTDPGACCGCLN